jgi:opacity protein-like surface antigen
MEVLKRYFCKATLIALSIALARTSAQAQAAPSAYGPGHSLWAGAEYSNITASFPYGSNQRLQGVGVFANYHLTSRIALTGDARFLTFGGFESSTESSYLAGPRFVVFAHGRLRPYGQFRAGIGRIHYPYDIGDAGYFALAPAGGTEYRLSSRFMLQGEYEYQFWLNSPGFDNQPGNRLTPNGFHVGIAYRMFGTTRN